MSNESGGKVLEVIVAKSAIRGLHTAGEEGLIRCGMKNKWAMAGFRDSGFRRIPGTPYVFIDFSLAQR